MQVCTLLLAHLTLLSFTERFLVDRILASASQLFLVCLCPPCAITRFESDSNSDNGYLVSLSLRFSTSNHSSAHFSSLTLVIEHWRPSGDGVGLDRRLCVLFACSSLSSCMHAMASAMYPASHNTFLSMHPRSCGIFATYPAFFTMMVGLAMGELCSSIPTSTSYIHSLRSLMGIVLV